MIQTQQIKTQLYPNFQLNYKYYEGQSTQEEGELSRFNQFMAKKNEIDGVYRKQIETLTEQMMAYQRQLQGTTQAGRVKDKIEHLTSLWDIQHNQLAGFNSQVQETIIAHNEAFLAQQKLERKQFQSCAELDNILRQNIERVQSVQKEYQTCVQRQKGDSKEKQQVAKKLEYEYDQYNSQLDNLFTQYNRQEEVLFGQQQQRSQQIDDTVMRYIVFMIGYLKNQQYDVDRLITRFQSSTVVDKTRRYIDQEIQAKYIITKIYLQSFLQKMEGSQGTKGDSVIETFTRKFSLKPSEPEIKMERQQIKSMKTTDQLHSMEGDQSIDSVDSALNAHSLEEDNQILVSHSNEDLAGKQRLTQEITRTMQEMQATERQLTRKQKEIEKEIQHLVHLLFSNQLAQEQLAILLQFVDFDTLDFFLDEIEQQRYQQYMEDTPFHQLGSLLQTLVLYIQKNGTFIKHKVAFSNQAVQAVIRICNMSKQSFKKNNQTIYQLYIAQVLNYDLTIYKRFFLQNFTQIFNQNNQDQDQLVADQVSFLIYIGLNYQQLETCLSSLKEEDSTRYKQIMNSANVQFLNTHQMIHSSLEPSHTSAIRSFQQRDKWRT